MILTLFSIIYVVLTPLNKKYIVLTPASPTDVRARLPTSLLLPGIAFLGRNRAYALSKRTRPLRAILPRPSGRLIIRITLPEDDFRSPGLTSGFRKKRPFASLFSDTDFPDTLASLRSPRHRLPVDVPDFRFSEIV